MLQAAQPAGEKETGSGAETFDALNLDGGSGGNPLIEEKILTAPYTRIVIDLGLSKLSDGANTLSAAERAFRARGLG
jgi:hypothetical protein